eukprot:1161796-Pelagomonas_calceolata.AAC.14
MEIVTYIDKKGLASDAVRLGARHARLCGRVSHRFRHISQQKTLVESNLVGIPIQNNSHGHGLEKCMTDLRCPHFAIYSQQCQCLERTRDPAGQAENGEQPHSMAACLAGCAHSHLVGAECAGNLGGGGEWDILICSCIGWGTVQLSATRCPSPLLNVPAVLPRAHISVIHFCTSLRAGHGRHQANLPGLRAVSERPQLLAAVLLPA